MPHRLMPSFERTLVQQNTKIQSICKDCRAVIVASVSEGLQNQELEHAQQCPESRVPSSQAS